MKQLPALKPALFFVNLIVLNPVNLLVAGLCEDTG